MTFLKPGNDVRVAMLAQLHHDPAPSHLVRDRAGRAGTGEGIENQIAGIRRNVE